MAMATAPALQITANHRILLSFENEMTLGYERPVGTLIGTGAENMPYLLCVLAARKRQACPQDSGLAISEKNSSTACPVFEPGKRWIDQDPNIRTSIGSSRRCSIESLKTHLWDNSANLGRAVEFEGSPKGVDYNGSVFSSRRSLPISHGDGGFGVGVRV
jgi:hypothetical protein